MTGAIKGTQSRAEEIRSHYVQLVISVEVGQTLRMNGYRYELIPFVSTLSPTLSNPRCRVGQSGRQSGRRS